MTILTASGQPAAPVQSNAKRKHDAETMKREQASMESLLKSLLQGYMRDSTPDPNKPALVHADPDALRSFYCDKWVDAARTMNASDLPLNVDEEALGKIIDEHAEHAKRQAEATMPLSAVPDLSLYELKLVGMSPVGMVWINSTCAVAVADSGLVHVWLRHELEPMATWAEGWLPPQRDPVVIAVGYTMQELHTLLAGKRVVQMANLPEELMNSCRIRVRTPWYLVQVRMHVVQLLGWVAFIAALVSLWTVLFLSF